MKTVFITLLLIILLICVGCHKRNPNNFTLISYGFAGFDIEGIKYNFDNSEKVYKVAKKWGITFESRGCVVNDSIIGFIHKNNSEAEENIEEKFGKNWKEKFNTEVNLEMKKK